MRRSDHPSRPKAMTCCFFSSFKTLLTSTEGIALASTQRPECWLIVGRFSGDYAWPVLGDHRGLLEESSFPGLRRDAQRIYYRVEPESDCRVGLRCCH